LIENLTTKKLMGVGKNFINGKLFSLKENTRFATSVFA
jgi:hypothetical protein